MCQILYNLCKFTLSFLVLLVIFRGNSRAETVWSEGGTYSEGGTITDGLKITASDPITITGKYTISPTNQITENSALLFYGAGAVTIEEGGELSLTNWGVNAYAGLKLNVNSGATMNLSTGQSIRFSRTGTVGDGKTVINWAGTGTWNLNSDSAILMSATNKPDVDSASSEFNITGGSLEIKRGVEHLAFTGTNTWNVSDGTLTVGDGALTLTFGGGWYNGATAAITGTISLTGTGTMNVRGTGDMVWGAKHSTDVAANLSLSIGSGATFSSTRNLTVGELNTGTKTITLAGGTFESPNLSDQKKTRYTRTVAAGIATSLTASSTFNVDQGVTLNYESPVTGPTDAPTESTKVTLTKTGEGNLRFTSDSNAMTNVSLDIKAGWVGISSQDDVHDVAFNGGGLALIGTGAATFNLTYTQTAALKLANAGDLTLSGDMNFSTYGLVKSGAGTMYLTGTNSNKENGIQVTQGVLAITDAKNVGGSTLKNAVYLNGGTLRVTGDVTLHSIYSDSGTVEVSDANSRLYLQTEGLNPYNAGKVHKTGAGLLEIALNESASNGTLPLVTYLDEGTIKIHREKTLTSNKTVEMQADTTFQFDGGYETISAKFDVKGNATLEIFGNRTLDFDGILTGSEGVTITKAGPATMKLSSAKENAANILVSTGNLELAKADGAAAAVDLTLNSGTNLLVSAQNQAVTGKVTLNSGSKMRLNVTESEAYSSFAAETLDVKDGSKIEIAFNDSINPFSLGTLELVTADEYQVNGTKLTTQDELNDFLKSYVTLNSNWAQMTIIPTATGFSFGVQTDFNKIPEPATWVLLLLGVGILGIRKR